MILLWELRAAMVNLPTGFKQHTNRTYIANIYIKNKLFYLNISYICYKFNADYVEILGVMSCQISAATQIVINIAY